MNKTLFSLQTAKPLLLASAVALALTACGGSGGSNAPTPDQPSKPIEPESGKKPESNAKPQAQQPKDNSGNAGSNTTPKKPDSKSNQPKPNQPDSNQPKPNQPNPNQPDPNSAWTNPPELTDLKNPVGSSVVTYTLFDGDNLESSNKFEHKKKPLQDIADDIQSFKAEKDKVVLKKALLEEIHRGKNIPDELTLNFPTSSGVKVEMLNPQIGVSYSAKKFGYEKAQAFHYYGRIGTRPFAVAYSMGEQTKLQDVQNLHGAIVYKGPSSFLPNAATEETPLEKGEATITLNTAEKTLDAVITLPQRFNKSYSFDQIGYKDAASFKQEGQDKAISGYFYGDQAQHIGGAYYVPEGAGAFITEKQP